MMEEYELWHRQDMSSLTKGIINLDPEGERICPRSGW